jgi:hypothetical protein
MTASDNRCIGADPGEYRPHGCPHPPAFIVGGDPACRHHLVRVVRQRVEECGDRPVSIDIWRSEYEE